MVGGWGFRMRSAIRLPRGGAARVGPGDGLRPPMPAMLLGLALGWAADVVGALEVETERNARIGECRVLLTPSAHAGSADPPRLRLTLARDGALGIDVAGADAAESVVVVSGDRRVPVTADWSSADPMALVERLPWLELLGSAPVHVTARLPSGGYATSRYDHLDGLAMLGMLRAHCDWQPPPGGRGCAVEALAAHTAGGALVEGLLDACRSDSVRSTARLAACRGGRGTPDDAALARGVRQLHERRLAGPVPADAGAALADLSREIRLRRVQRDVVRAAARNRLLLRQRRALEEAEGAALADEGPLEGLVLALLAPGRCDAITVALDSDGRITVSGYASDAASLGGMRGRLGLLGSISPVGRFSVEVRAGGACRESIGGGWGLLADGSGSAVEQVTYSPELAELDALPRPGDLVSLSRHARRHPELGPFFARGQTPLVWCRDDGELGICRRDGYGPEWTFQPSRGVTYSGFVVLFSEDGK